MKHNHLLWMILACAIPLLIVLLLPVFGIKSNYSIIIAMVSMIVMHLFMMRDHRHKHDEASDSNNKKRISI
ncbi:TPA: hypothetical protein HA235_03895 [Candidatus Woesearchaeota archaeon]|nr:hypothetical protein [uncultured archaeon]MBS3173319.1 hypothetical protein [Candidatus Woesearchaeota archaeon]HIH31825.1 hypothetical protein [Candidatus Woesearchaeota archaeon]HIH55460.1 hypothetical protein [Candidatus Woesearchaeota archaeon]HIJ01898.1 hypothetical protein [Candidatus Woesearchaeota archaeon]